MNSQLLPSQNRHSKESFVFWIKKIIKVFILLIFLFLSTHSHALAQSSDQASFGIRPTKSYEGKPETNAYFSYESSAGSVINDEALIINDGKVGVILKIFAADGVTAQNGGTSLVSPDDPGLRTGDLVSSWITLATDHVVLQPGEQVSIPFTVTVPNGVEPGQHIGGIMVESLPSSSDELVNGNEDSQFSVNVIKRVGVALVVDIPGVHKSALTVDQIGFDTQNEQGATFAVKIINIGNVLTSAEGNFLIKDSDNNMLSSLPIIIETILPGDSTTVYLFQPLNLADGDYSMSVGLIYDGGTAILEGISLKIRDGKAVTGDAEALSLDGANQEQVVQTIKPANYSISNFWLFIRKSPLLITGVAIGIVFLSILLLGGLDWKKRRKNRIARKKYITKN